MTALLGGTSLSPQTNSNDGQPTASVAAQGDQDPIDSLTQTSNWYPVFAALPNKLLVRVGDHVDLRFTTRISDDGVHLGYELAGKVEAGLQEYPFSWDSPHHAGGLREPGFYQRLSRELVAQEGSGGSPYRGVLVVAR